MKALLICPAERPAVAALSQSLPLALIPFAGKCMIEYWMEHLATLKVEHVTIVASDRPELIKHFVDGGARWGVNSTIVVETREITPNFARLKHQTNSKDQWLAEPNDAIVMDHFPGLAHHSLFKDYAGSFSALQSWLPRAATLNRIGFKEIQNGVWASARSRIASTVQFKGPCWIGENVRIGPRATIGPMAVIEDRALILAESEISNSIIGPETLVGRLTEVKNSIAWGNTLINWKMNSCVSIPDPSLLCALSHHTDRDKPNGWMGHLSSLYTRNKDDFHVLWKHLLMKKKDKGIL